MGAWMGLSTALSGLAAAQAAMDTAAHNIANANTEGFSRQRVGLTASPPSLLPAFNRTGLPGQVGAGVTISTILRVRDQFLDGQLRGQAPVSSYWDTRRDELSKVEAIFPEPAGAGIGSTLSAFWSAWHDVAASPTSTAARASLLDRAATVATQVNAAAGQIVTLARNLDGAVVDQVKLINDYASQIAALNRQIQGVVATGDAANDLSDQRDLVLDKLTAILPATLSHEANGTVTVLVGGTDLVSRGTSRTIVTVPDLAGHAVPTWVTGGTVALGQGGLAASTELRDTTLPGYLASLNSLATGIADAVNAVHTRGYDSTGAAGLPLFTYVAGNAAATMALNTVIAADSRRLAAAGAAGSPGDGGIAGQIADLQDAFSYPAGTAGADLVPGIALATNGSATVTAIGVSRATAQTWTLTSGAPGQLTITGTNGATQTIAVADMISGAQQTLNFTQLGIQITLGASTAKAAGDIITDLTAGANDTLVVASILNPPQTIMDAYAGLVSGIGSDVSHATDLAANQQLLVDHLQQRRQSTSGVSLDQEAADMIRFQHAYQAAARVITTIDEMLDTLINRTGTVGR